MLKRKVHNKISHTNILPAVLLAVLSLWPALPAAKASVPSLPVLNWQQRSDWVNVKTDVTPTAYGDGIHDDTAAIQAGLNILPQGGYGRKTLYLPAGTYRISRTLTLTKVNGALIVGQGQSTRIVWNGPLRQTMFWSNGACYGHFWGIVWDGANKASVGIDHQSRTQYEEGVRHEDEAFVNFRDSGIRVGYNEQIPTSEMTYRNCLFQNCGNGVSFLAYNDVNNTFSGCEFQGNGISLNCVRGNVHVRDCHFERSATTDVFLLSQAHSVRRCTSVGSKQFIRTPDGGAGCTVTIQDCHVDRWTGTQGAIQLGIAGVNTIFDCSFTNPPDSDSPIRLSNYTGWTQTVLASNNTAPGSSSLVNLGGNGHLTTLPAGARGPSVNDPMRSFFKTIETVPTSILDVKTRFGAIGDGYHDDTAAITNALNAARTQGGGAVVYLPTGNYLVSSTLPVQGSNYTVEGSGYQSVIHWAGPHGGTVFRVQDPHSIAVKQLSFEVPHDVVCIQQTSLIETASRITYSRLWTNDSGFLTPGDISGPNGHVAYSSGTRGLECIGLPSTATVILDDFAGTMHFTDCSRATILSGFAAGIVQVDGARYEKSGFCGVLAHNNAGCFYDTIVRDNQDFVGTDFYTEQTNSALYVSGNGALPGQLGHVIIQGSRVQTYDPIFARIDNYEGRVSYCGSGLEASPSPGILHVGTRPVDIVLLANTVSNGQPTVSLGTGGRMTTLENFSSAFPVMVVVPNFLPGLDAPASQSLLTANSTGTQAALAPAVATLDDFRLLGAYDMALNYP